MSNSDINLTNRRQWFKSLLKKYPRIAMTGGPKSGKTTLSRLANGSRTVIHTDDFRESDREPDAWSKASQMVTDTVNEEKGKLLVEGVAVPRALRKGMKVDAVLWLGCHCYSDNCACGDKAIEPLKTGQRSMKKGQIKVFSEWHANNKHIPVFQAPPPVAFVGDEDEFDDE